MGVPRIQPRRAVRFSAQLLRPLGVQIATMAHLNLPNNPEVSFGVGLSGGGFEPTDIRFCPFGCVESAVAHYDFAVWNNYALSFEVRGQTGVLWGGFFGAACLLNRGDYDCVDCSATDRPDPPVILPDLGFALGHAFG